MEGNAPPKLSISELDDVRLIVKSANQQFDDVIVHSEPSWNILRLKAHLSQVYPSNPTVSEQKLIYSGQLLSDDLILKDILRSYKDVETENHIFHLVYTPKIYTAKSNIPEFQSFLSNKSQNANADKPTSPPVIPASTSTDGLRHRNVNQSSSSSKATTSSASEAAASSNAPAAGAAQTPPPPQATTVPPSQQIPNFSNPFAIPQVVSAAGCPSNYPNVMLLSYPDQIDYSGVLTEQQAAMQTWVQQIYTHYMEHCFKLANLTMNEPQMQSNAPSIPMFIPMMPHFVPPTFPNLQMTTTTKAAPATATAAAPATATAAAAPSPAAATAANSVPPEEFDGPSTSQAARAAFAPRIIPVIPSPVGQPQHQPQPQPQPQPQTQPQSQSQTQSQSATGIASPTVGTASTPRAAAAPPGAPVVENVEQAQPRFPNIIQEEPDNRDWLESFYSITRLLALFTLVFFYSSPLRCLVVAIIAIGIYLYHSGYFPTRRPAQGNNNNNPNINNNNNNVPAAGDAAQQQPQDAANASAASASSTSTETNQNTAGDSEPLISSVTPPEAETATTSLIAFVRTFVVSFFASLLPETPAL